MSVEAFTEYERWCPICRRGKMQQRTNRKKGNTFLGCSNYPACDFTMEDPESPKDDADEDVDSIDRDHRWDRDD